MTIQTQAPSASYRYRPRWLRAAGWLVVGVAGVYALFALTIAVQTAAALLGLTEPTSTRAAAPLFVVHAVTGAVALLAASVQLGLLAPPTPRQRGWHRAVGRAYVLSAVLTSVLSMPVAVAYDVDNLTRAAFLGEAALWLVTTMLAYIHIRARRVEPHREWMIRSFALAAFFVTFSLWDPFLAALPLPPATAFALAVVLGWLVNLVIAEAWIRRTRGRAHGRGQGPTGS